MSQDPTHSASAQLPVRVSKFKEFNILEEFKDAHNFAAIITSKRRTGKSVLMKDICYQLFRAKWIDEAYVFSSTAHLQPDLFDYVPEENVCKGLDPNRLKDIWAAQETKVKKLMDSGVPKDKIPCTLILFDDVAGDTKGCRYSDILTEFFLSGRHVRFTQIFVQQYILCVPPKIRANIDWFACFKINRALDRKTIVESYIDLEPKKALQVLQDITAVPESYQCMIVNLLVNGTDPETYIRTYTARLKVPKFLFERKHVDSPRRIGGREGYKWLV